MKRHILIFFAAFLFVSTLAHAAQMEEVVSKRDKWSKTFKTDSNK